MPEHSENKRKKSSEEYEKNEVEESSDESSSEEYEDESESENEETDEITNAEFEAFDPLPEDKEGIKALLKQLFKKEPIELGLLTDYLVENNDLCTVLKQLTEDLKVEDDDEDVFSLTTILQLNKKELADNQSIKLIKNFLIRTARESGNKEIVNLLEDKKQKSALILNERFINLPAKVGLLSLKNLMDELKEKKLEFDNFIIICKLLKAKDEKAFKKHKHKRSKQDENGLIFLNGEDSILTENALSKYEFEIADDDSDLSVTQNWKDGQAFTPYRKVILLNQAALTRSLEILEKDLNENQMFKSELN